MMQAAAGTPHSSQKGVNDAFGNGLYATRGPQRKIRSPGCTLAAQCSPGVPGSSVHQNVDIDRASGRVGMAHGTGLRSKLVGNLEECILTDAIGQIDELLTGSRKDDQRTGPARRNESGHLIALYG
ncbi:MAG: hypothetical protein R2855_10665 [Thermomicrobiales bacterium]